MTHLISKQTVEFQLLNHGRRRKGFDAIWNGRTSKSVTALGSAGGQILPERLIPKEYLPVNFLPFLILFKHENELRRNDSIFDSAF